MGRVTKKNFVSLRKEDHFNEHHLFYEFFHGDKGQGLGASHQTGWTALIVNLLLEMDED